jgi:hypothetical protein
MGSDQSKPATEAPTANSTADHFPFYDPEKAPHYTTDCKNPKDVILSKEGLASENSTTLMAWFKKIAEDPVKGGKAALAVERPCPPMDGRKVPPALPRDQWKTWSNKEYYEESRTAAKGMMAMGLVQFDGVNIYGFNAPEWFMGEMAGIFAGGVAAGIYPPIHRNRFSTNPSTATPLSQCARPRNKQMCS